MLCFVSGTILLGATLKINLAPIQRTKAPGELSCGGCHSGNINTGPGSVSWQLPASYVPGQTYAITVSVNDNAFPNGRFGFTGTILDNNNQRQGTFQVLNSNNTSLQSGMTSGALRQYIGHANADGNATWTFNWTAPATAAGPLKVYTVGVAANGNSSTNNDRV
ncbi:MAG: hypothetical protein OHK0039_28300 [Bacteroidia bacterium]